MNDRIISLSSTWENNLIQGSLDSALVGLRDRINRFITSLQETSNNDDFDTNGIAEFIQDTQTWLINHLIKSCLLPLKDCLDITHQETLTRIQQGIKHVWQKLASRFEVGQECFFLNTVALS